MPRNLVPQQPEGYFAAYDSSDSILINTLVNIIAFVRANSFGEDISNYNGLYSWDEEKPIQDSWSGRQKYTRMKPALLEVLSDLQLISNLQGPVEDQLVYGMIRTRKSAKLERKGTPDVPIWVPLPPRCI